MTNTAGAPATITATAGTPQSTTVNTAFATALQATVRDASNNPLAGVAVTFSAPASGASGTFSGSATVVTNASGIATAPTFTANAIAGAYNVTATAGALSTTFALTNSAGAPATIAATVGTPQSTTVNTAFATALQAKVVDASNNPLSGVSVTFSAPASGASGTFSGSATVVTNASGVATAPTFTANGIAGAYNVTATAGALSTTFALTNNAAAQTATHFRVSFVSNLASNVVVSVAALDASNTTVVGYLGTIHFSSSAPATLPADYTFIAADQGVHTFTLQSAPGGQTITVTDVTNASITGANSTTVMCPIPPAGPLPTSPIPGAPLLLCAGTTATLTAPTFPGGATYAWSILNGQILIGAGTSTVTIRAGSSGSVTVSVLVTPTLSCGGGTYQSTIGIRPAATAHITQTNVLACANQPATIFFTLTGTAPFSVVWSDGVHQDNLPFNSAARTVTVDHPTTLNIVSVADASPCGSGGASNDVHVVPTNAPVITRQPHDVSVTLHGTAHLDVGVFGDNVTFQWYEGAVGDTSHPAAGGGNGALDVPDVTAVRHFWVRVSTNCGNADSEGATVTPVTRRRAAGH